MSSIDASAITPLRGGDVISASGFTRRLLRHRLSKVCVAYLLLVVIITIVAPIVLPGVAHENAGDLSHTLRGPSLDHLLGTDQLGRDLLDRLLVGTRMTMVGVAEGLLVALAIGLPVGLAAGFYGGWFDQVVVWLSDLAFSIPGLIVIIIVLTIFPFNMLAGMSTFGVLASPALMRVVRSATLPVREELYIAAAQVSGLSRPYILGRHILPRISGAVIVQASLIAAHALIVQSGLSFLGLLVNPPAPSWGGMVADGIQVLTQQPWLIWPPGIAIGLTVLALTLLGDAIRDTATETWSASSHRKQRTRPSAKWRNLKPGSRRPVASIGLASTDVAAGSTSGLGVTIPDAKQKLLAVHGLTVGFASGPDAVTHVVEDVSFDVDVGERIGLVGESGCGKTITAMAILGLLPGTGRVLSGEIVFQGRDLIGLPERELRAIRGREIALISQEPMTGLNPMFRVGWQIAEAVRCHHGVSRREAHGRTLELLRRVHMRNPEDVARRYPHELSGGMAQRVAIARALSGDPKLLIADEPTTALDVTLQAEILELLRELQETRGLSVLLVTHDWGVVADCCDRAVVMYAGEVVERSDVRPLFYEPLHPYTAALLASNPHNTQPGVEALPTIPGGVPSPGSWPSGCHFHPRCAYTTAACREQAIPLMKPAPGRETRCIHFEQLAIGNERAAR